MRSKVTFRALVGLALSLLALVPSAAIAATEIFKGTLNPETSDPRIPVVVEIEDVAGRLIGGVQTSWPMPGQGRLLSGEKRLGECQLKVYLGEGATLAMSGRCGDMGYIGAYQLSFPERNETRAGTFALKPMKPEEKKKRLSESERWSLASSTNTACIKANTTCLAACPRDGDYNTQFLCANNCKRKLAACKARRKKLLDPELAPPD